MNASKKLLAIATSALLGMGLAQQASAVAINTDIIAVVDESGSMSSEHAWLPGMISALDTALAAAAGTDPFNAQYGLVGFGGSSSSGHIAGHTHSVGGADLGSASDFGTAAGTLVTNGSYEDGYSGMLHALSYTPSQTGALKNLILVTDEDRDDLDDLTSRADDKSNMVSALSGSLLNAVVNCQFTDGNGNRALGIDSAGNAYIADGNGGYTRASGGTQSGSCSGTTFGDYVELALGTGGAAWDLGLLRSGGSTADSFTAAFVAIKVRETTIPRNVPEPGTLVLLGLGMAGAGIVRRKRKAA